MPEPTPHSDPYPDDLALRALLYSSGELEGEEAAAFEARLAVDQEARDALAQAVELTLTAAGERRAPDAEWREETRARLLQRASLWQRMAGPRVYRGHPAVWSIFGALAASLILSLMQPPPTTTTQAHVAPAAAAMPSAEEASHWAELTNNNHLAAARDEVRRKQRADDRSRMIDERRLPRAGSIR